MGTRPKSKNVFEKLCEVIPGGVNSPVRTCRSVGHPPMVVSRAYQDTLVDEDGKEYIDYCCSWGALIHGHAHPQITDAVQKRMALGTSFGITTGIEGEIAKEIVQLIDSVEKIRFVSSGTEATMTAARLARGFTQRDYIIKFSGNYHGHADFFLVQAGSGVLEISPTASSAGIPADIVKYTICLPYNDIEAVRKTFTHPDYKGKIAAVILEPIAGNMGMVPADPQFIQALREETEKDRAVLIFDEVITGLRVGLKGAQGYYGVKPDLSCFGKIIGGGFPAAAFGGRKEIMDFLAPLGPVYQAGTLSGNPVAMEAGLQSLRMLQKPGFYAELERKMNILLDPIEAKIREKNWNVCIYRNGSMFTFFFGKRSVRNMAEAKEIDTDQYGRFFRALFAEGIYAPPSPHETWFISSAHTDAHLIKTRDAILKFLEEECV